MIDRFIKKYWDRKNPLLLGCSGGADSKALLYLLLEKGVKNLHVAHVDHGWREESQEEALSLKREVESLGLPFYLKKIQPFSKNKEALSREARLQFFKSLFEKIPFQALLLAHHGDDVAETALKKVLEGAHLPFLEGIKEVTVLDGLPIWRPLLETRKLTLYSYLEKKNLSFFEDATNKDPKYLRSKMRCEILPDLSRSFGKNLSENLMHLSKRSKELREYLERKSKEIPVLEGPFGKVVDLKNVELLEARFVLQKMFEKQKIKRDLLEQILIWAKEKTTCKRASSQIIVDRERIFFLKEKTSLPNKAIEIDLPGIYALGFWKIHVSNDCLDVPSLPKWEDLWLGKATLQLPQEKYTLKRASSKEAKSFSPLWNEEKVPTFLRREVPALFVKEKMKYDFFLKKSRISEKEPPFFSVRITYSK